MTGVQTCALPIFVLRCCEAFQKFVDPTLVRLSDSFVAGMETSLSRCKELVLCIPLFINVQAYPIYGTTRAYTPLYQVLSFRTTSGSIIIVQTGNRTKHLSNTPPQVTQCEHSSLKDNLFQIKIQQTM